MNYEYYSSKIPLPIHMTGEHLDSIFCPADSEGIRRYHQWQGPFQVIGLKTYEYYECIHCGLQDKVLQKEDQ